MGLYKSKNWAVLGSLICFSAETKVDCRGSSSSSFTSSYHLHHTYNWSTDFSIKVFIMDSFIFPVLLLTCLLSCFQCGPKTASADLSGTSFTLRSTHFQIFLLSISVPHMLWLSIFLWIPIFRLLYISMLLQRFWMLQLAMTIFSVLPAVLIIIY